MSAAISGALATPSMPRMFSPSTSFARSKDLGTPSLGSLAGDTSAPAANFSGTDPRSQSGIPPGRLTSVTFQEVAVLLRGIDDKIIDHHRVGACLALDASAIHRAIQNGRLTQWIDFGGRARFWFVHEMWQLFDAIAIGYKSENLRELVLDLERERQERLSEIARLLARVDDIGNNAEATASARMEKRLLTFEQVCLDGNGFSTMRLPYRRRHLDNLRSAKQFMLPVIPERGAFLRVDVRDVARLQIQSAIDTMVDRAPALIGSVVPRTKADV